MKPVNLQEVIEAVDLQGDEISHFYDRATGGIVMVMGEDIRAAENGRAPDGFPDWQQPQIALAIQILSDDSKRFVELPDRFEVDEYRLMERFALGQPDSEVSEQLAAAIRGRGAFRRFKDAIHRLGVADEWYKRQAEHLARVARDWCEHLNIPYYVEDK